MTSSPRSARPDPNIGSLEPGRTRARGPASAIPYGEFPPGYGGPHADDFEIVRQRLLRWPRAEHEALLNLPAAELRVIYEAILYLDARPAASTNSDTETQR